MRITTPRMAVLETVRFGEFLRDQMLLSEEQWLSALAAHWSDGRRRRFGAIVVALGYLPRHRRARRGQFHDGLDVVEVGAHGRARPRDPLIGGPRRIPT
jgi:hypothetical protein